MIDHLIHFYKKDTEPFRSLSALPEQRALDLMQELYIEGSVFWERFKDPGEYLRLRRQTEGWLRQAFIAKGGAPRDAYPIYLVLGMSKWLQTSLDPATAATTVEIHVPLSLFKECELSFTYPDSMVSYLIAQEKGSKYYLPEYHGKVFTLPEIRSIIEANGLPGEKWGTNLPPDLANYIEAQVWNREALMEYRRKISN